MSVKKLLLKGLALLALVAIVSACVATLPAAAPAATEAEPAAEPAAPAAEPAAASSDEKITLRWANIMDATGQEQWKPVIEAFKAAHPNIDVVIESTAGSGAAVYPDVLKTSMASGSPPDFSFMWGGSVAQPFIDAGQAKDLAPYYDKYDWNGKFAPWVIDRITSDGKLYGVPYKAMGMGLWYRKDIF